MTPDRETPRVLILTEGSYLAHVTRCLVAAKAIAAAGAEVVLACSGSYAHLVRAAGHAWRPIFTKPGAESLEAARRRLSAYTVEMIERYVGDELRLIAELRPHLVLSDMRPSVAISAEIAGVTHLALANTYVTRFGEACTEAPQTMPLFAAMPRALSRLLLSPLRALILRLAVRPFNAVRRRLGLEPWPTIQHAMEGRDGTLLVDATDLAPAVTAHPGVTQVGPLLWEPAAELPAWWAQLPSDRPTIYLSTGSTGGQSLLAAAIEAFAGSSFQVMVTGKAEVALPPNFWHAALAPGLQLARRADVVLCHGGNGTIYQALAAGRPVVAVPHFFEQELNAQLLRRRGLGAQARADAVELRRAVADACDEGDRRRAEHALTAARITEAARWAPERLARAVLAAARDKVDARRAPVSAPWREAA